MFLLAFRHITPNERFSEVGNFPVDISPERCLTSLSSD